MAGEKIDDKAAKPSGGAAMNSDSKLWSALCYVFPIISIVVLVTDKKNDKFVLFHAWQSLIAWIGAWIVGMVVTVVTLGIGGLCFPLIWLGFLYFGYKAYQGEKFLLPVVGEFAEKQMAK
jgi:uncharacterized membrane protein